MIKDLKEQVFGRLFVVDRSHSNKKGNSIWNCICICGNKKQVLGYLLTGGMTQSCGCLHREAIARINYKHGMTATRSFTTWSSMKQRCFDPTNKRYHRYGGRGITVCERWKEFANFFADMGDPPKGLQLDRIDNDKDYSPENCRWVTSKINNRNRGNNRLITIQGQEKCLSEWCEIYGIGASAVHRRRRLRPCSWEAALSTPVGKFRGVA